MIELQKASDRALILELQARAAQRERTLATNARRDMGTPLLAKANAALVDALGALSALFSLKQEQVTATEPEQGDR